ncbi:MAG: hypothetical protein OEV37_04205 [Candidatus Berkelbacteria bacterium]|nr:hypothetical protein [Candidatus Berkelbacteria bacterium]
MPLLTPLHQNPESILGAEPAAWSALFVEAGLLLLGLVLLAGSWLITGTIYSPRFLFNAAIAFAAVCLLLATAEGACKTGMLLFAGCSAPTFLAFSLNVRQWLDESRRAGPYLLAGNFVVPLVTIRGLLYGQ